MKFYFSKWRIIINSTFYAKPFLKSRIPEEDITGFCLWLKNELQDTVSKVSISKRLKDTPALVSG